MLTLKTKVEGDEQVSTGIAIVQFSTQEGASTALRNLALDQSLGDPKHVVIEYYQSLESRLMNAQNEDDKDLQRQYKLLDDGFAPQPPDFVIQALLNQQQTMTGSTSSLAEQQHDSPSEQLMFKPPVSVQEFECPNYFIRRPAHVPPPLDVNRPVFKPNWQMVAQISQQQLRPRPQYNQIRKQKDRESRRERRQRSRSNPKQGKEARHAQDRKEPVKARVQKDNRGRKDQFSSEVKAYQVNY